MTAALPFIAMAVTAGGKIVEGIGARDAAYAQGQALDENARLSVLAGEQQGWQTRLQERRQTGEMLSAQGGSGVQMGTGTAADLIAENSYQRELEILGIRQKAVRQANNYTTQANDTRAAGRAALTGSIFSAVSGALNSVSAMREQRSVSASNASVRAAQADRAPPMTIGG
ncbi:hypothetical protein S2M10_29310 [Sphingomonas sp. S2M10]|uniref:hypothetical protein n=1 Tax=Sphingomonas sp. S2M10 TaxID=2705010 RepID=UPI001456AFB4|nr:hypothetical protein [Sphingomonas sp. S2M10]NLS27929.1 hypothetical protein [Sphingomonas sp. S2M10]